MQITSDDLVVARVLSEDKDFMVLEVIKNDFKEVSISGGDQFYILAFVTNVGGSRIEIGKPWEVNNE